VSSAYSLPQHLPPLDCLLAALAVARTGSFSAAALELGVTHAAISRRVAGAETWAGLPLFIRHARGAKPTPDGERLLTRIWQGLDLLDHAADRGRKVRRPVTVRLATTPSMARFWLLERLAALEQAAGGLRIELLTESRLVDLAGEGVDLALRYGAGRWPGVRSQALFAHEELVPLVHRALLAPGRHAPKALLGLPRLFNADASGWRHWCEAQGLAFRAQPADRTLQGYELVQQAARCGLGVALVQAPLLEAEPPPELWLARQWAVKARLGWHLLRPAERPLGEGAERVARALLQLARP